MVLLISLLFFVSCTNPPYLGDDSLGVNEFIIDSYKIREGKLAILELEGKTLPPLPSNAFEEYPELIEEGDILSLVLYYPMRSDLSQTVANLNSTLGFRVRNKGISLPDLAFVSVAGLTLEEAAKRIQEAYERQYQGVEIFLSFRERLERKIELAGLVRIATLPADGKLRLFEALAKAGITPEANLFKSYIAREGSLLPIDFYKLVKEGDMRQNIVLHSGDKIYIADSKASNAMVLGEVGKEKVLPLPNGFLSLREAIASAEGIPFTGNKSYIQIFRGNVIQPKIYTLNWTHIIHLPSDSLLIMPGDIVYVAATPITEWNRFLNQLFPTFIGLDLMFKGVKGIGIIE